MGTQLNECPGQKYFMRFCEKVPEDFLHLQQFWQDKSTTFMRISSSLLQEIQTGRSIRGAGRLYFALLAYNNFSGCVPMEYAKLFVFPFFSDYQVKKYMSVLLKQQWVRVDKFNNIRVTGQRYIVKWIGRHKGQGMLFVKVNDELLKKITQNQSYWNEFIAGHSVAVIARYMARGEFANGAVLLNRQKVDGEHRIAQPISCEILAKNLAVSKSSASRWRKKGQPFGYKLTEQYELLGLKATTSKFARLRYDMKDKAKRLIARKGELALQKVSTVTMVFSAMFEWGNFSF